VLLGWCDGAGMPWGGLHLAVVTAGGIMPTLAARGPGGSDAWRARGYASRSYTSAGWARSELASAALGWRGPAWLGLAVWKAEQAAVRRAV